MIIALFLIIVLLFAVILFLYKHYHKVVKQEKKLPDLMFFCDKGHIVAATNQAELIDEITQIPPCYCGSQHVRALANWPFENTEIVPNKVIRCEPAGLQSEIEVFDVSGLFSKDYISQWDINWEEIPKDILGRF